jgi:hypothetical protein
LTYDVPEEITVLMDLLGLFSMWNSETKRHQIYQQLGRERLRWKSQEFGGGSTREWQQFLSTITAQEHLAIP